MTACVFMCLCQCASSPCGWKRDRGDAAACPDTQAQGGCATRDPRKDMLLYIIFQSMVKIIGSNFVVLMIIQYDLRSTSILIKTVLPSNILSCNVDISKTKRYLVFASLSNILKLSVDSETWIVNLGKLFFFFFFYILENHKIKCWSVLTQLQQWIVMSG